MTRRRNPRGHDRPAVSLLLDAGDVRRLDAACRRRGLSRASYVRALLLAHLGQLDDLERRAPPLAGQ